jgi:GNAT superfamily N-acetyltransferase
MKVKIFWFLSLLIFVSAGYSQGASTSLDLSNYGVRIEADKRLIVVLAALEMAEVKDASGKSEKLLKTPLSDKGIAFREQLARDHAQLPDDLRQKIAIFVTQHKKRHAGSTDAEIVAPFISMAYALTPPPELADPVITTDLPGSLLDVLDFAPLVREFYRRSGIGSRLDSYAKAYQSDADATLRVSAREMVSELLNYLHTQPKVFITEKVTTQAKRGKGKSTIQQVETREHERGFMIVPEKLAPKGNITFLNIRDDYFVIVPPDTDLSLSDARRAFLQFVVDPLILSNSKEIEPIRAWARPILVERRKADSDISPDVFLAVSRSLVAAADVRQAEYSQIKSATQTAIRKIDQIQANAERSGRPIDKAKVDKEKLAVSAELDRVKQALSDEAALKLFEDYEKGAILAFYFAEQLKGVEDSGFDIASSLREMLASFDPLKETDRVASTAEARKRALAAREARKTAPDTVAVVAENPITRRLLDIQKIIDAKQYSKAEAELKIVLASDSTDPRVYYTLGRVASLEAAAVNDPDTQAQKLLEAKVAFSNVLSKATSDTDKALLSLTYVALARIYEYHDDNAYALKLYDMAIGLKEVAGGAYQDAMAAKQRLIKLQ